MDQKQTYAMPRDADGNIPKGNRRLETGLVTLLILCIFGVFFLVVTSVRTANKLGKTETSLATANAKVSQLETRNKELETANRVLGQTLHVITTVTPASAPKAEPSRSAYGKAPAAPTANELMWNPNGGEWTVILHTLSEKGQIAIEGEETAAAFKKCSEETDYILTPCVSIIKDQKIGPGYNTLMASLAKTSNGLNARWALRVAACFNRNMKLAKKKDGTVIPNTADAVKLRDFEPECLPVK